MMALLGLALEMAVMQGAGQLTAQSDTTGRAAGDAPVISRIRSSDPSILLLIQAGRERSPTLQWMVETVSATDGIVYVERGKCGHAVKACLVMAVTVAGPYRILRVLVESRKADCDVLESIGHELRHAVEVLSDPTVRSDAAVYFFFRREYERAGSLEPDGFETRAAVRTEAAIRAELRARKEGASACSPSDKLKH